MRPGAGSSDQRRPCDMRSVSSKARAQHAEQDPAANQSVRMRELSAEPFLTGPTREHRRLRRKVPKRLAPPAAARNVRLKSGKTTNSASARRRRGSGTAAAVIIWVRACRTRNRVRPSAALASIRARLGGPLRSRPWRTRVLSVARAGTAADQSPAHRPRGSRIPLRRIRIIKRRSTTRRPTATARRRRLRRGSTRFCSTALSAMARRDRFASDLIAQPASSLPEIRTARITDHRRSSSSITRPS